MTEHERFIRRETRMQNFRWATPAGIFVLGTMIVFFGWLGNDYLCQIRSSIVDLKVDGQDKYEKLWAAVSSNKNKTDCIQNQLAKCCHDSSYCG